MTQRAPGGVDPTRQGSTITTAGSPIRATMVRSGTPIERNSFDPGRSTPQHRIGRGLLPESRPPRRRCHHRGEHAIRLRSVRRGQPLQVHRRWRPRPAQRCGFLMESELVHPHDRVALEIPRPHLGRTPDPHIIAIAREEIVRESDTLRLLADR